MMVSVPSAARGADPLTGASTKRPDRLGIADDGDHDVAA